MEWIETNSPEETFAVGRELGCSAQPGEIYTLNGELGVGKTVFTQGFAAGLGITEHVNSPTFTIVQIYEKGRLPFYHFDLPHWGYRRDGGDRIRGLLLWKRYLHDRMG